MKTLRFFGMMLMTMVVAFGFTACGDDDDDNGKDKTDYVGVWISADTESRVEATIFDKSTWEDVIYSANDGKWTKLANSGTLSVNGNVMTFSGNGATSTATYSVSGNTITIIKNTPNGQVEPLTMTRATGGQQEKMSFLEILVKKYQD